MLQDTLLHAKWIQHGWMCIHSAEPSFDNIEEFLEYIRSFSGILMECEYSYIVQERGR